MKISISIHALLAESDQTARQQAITAEQFLSTLSLRRATRLPTALRTPHHKFLSTLSLRRATQIKQTCRVEISISIHALLAESDNDCVRYCIHAPISIHALLAESDIHYDNYNLHCVISIHALLAESDAAAN